MLQIKLSSILKILSLSTCFAVICADDFSDNSDNIVDGCGAESSPDEFPDLPASPDLKIWSSETPDRVEPGGNFSLVCCIRNASLESEIRWTGDKSSFIAIDDLTNKNEKKIVFGNVAASDSGNYTCQAETTDGILLNKTIRIRVKEYGQIFAKSFKAYAVLNQPATLTCYVHGYPNTADFVWIRESSYSSRSVVNATSRFKITTSYINETYFIMYLYFRSVTPEDQASYKCGIFDVNPIKYSSTYLYIMDVPIIKVTHVEAIGTSIVRLQWTVDERNSLLTKYSIQHTRTSTGQWQDTLESDKVDQNEAVIKELDKCTPYRFRIRITGEVGVSEFAYSDWVTTWEKDPEFVPNFWIEATTLHSISVGFSAPPAESQSYFHYYNVTLAGGDAMEKWYQISYHNYSYVFKDLEPGTSYTIKVAACNNYTFQCGNWSQEKKIVTIDRDPKFIPDISIEARTHDSITIRWAAPPLKLKNRVHQYKVLATSLRKTREPVYVDATANSHVFEKLKPETSYRFKVAACSEIKTQCADWSTEIDAVTVDENQTQNALWPTSLGVAALLLVVMFIWIVFRKRNEMAARRRFMEATLELFNNGNLDCIDPETNIGDQAELLPYDKKLELPRERLKLGKVLGCGAFGVVRKAEFKSTTRPPKITTVAVKMVRSTARLHCMTALSRELKILAHLGKHLNVVNLLGACTKNISYGELLVIVEFCRFGNLHDYLLHRRRDFVSEIDPVTGNIAGSSFTEDGTNANDSGMGTAGIDSSSATRDAYQSTDPTNLTVSVTIDGAVPETDPVELERSKYQGDYTDDNLEAICTRDLLCWAWQVSCGMNYLSSRRVLHGDLAARNVLLTDNNVVKICDFGLARDLYADDNYEKKGHDPLPLKWMALESIRDRVFSVKSDVWSYGIVLWEIFTLAETPYPGIEQDNVYQKLVDGFRMDKPEYAAENIYRVMLQCWDAEPSKRPSFEELADSIADLLDEGVKTRYIELGAPYVETNAKAMANRKRDYLTTIRTEDASDTKRPSFD